MILNLLVKWAAVSGLFLVAAVAVPAIKVHRWTAAVGAALVFGLINVVLGWPLRFIGKAILFLPNLLTFGLTGLVASVVINMIVLKATDIQMGPAMDINGLKPLLGLAVATSILTGIL
jgi:uncharacterized membrane protein YvlD (DUF360 family)